MTKQTILVTGATGKTGASVIGQLIDKGFPVRALVRRADERSERLAALGAAVIVGDLLDIASVRSAVDGVNRAYFVYPPAEGLLEATTCFAQAAKEAGLEAVVNMSQIIAREGHPSPLTRQHWLAERVLDWAEIGAIHIRPTFFAEMPFILNGTTITSEGRIYQPHGAGRHAPVTAEDIARVVAAVLENPTTHIGKTYVVTGPQAMSQDDIAAVFDKVLGKPVEYIDLPLDHWRRAMADAGLPAFVIEHLSRASVDHKNGAFDTVTDVVREITGQPAQAFEDFVRNHIGQLAPQTEALHHA